jgi:polysaccharide biosynthesis/export protein
MPGRQMSLITQELRSMLRFTNCLTIAIAMGLIGCAPTIQPGAQPDIAKVARPSAAEINKALATVAMNTSVQKADYQIGPEDLLQITVFNISDTEARDTPRTVSVRVSQEGMVSLPLIGDVKVAGLTTSGLERELQKQFDRYIYTPRVGVLVTEHRQRVSLIGAVTKTGVIELTGPKTVIEILAMAGGVTDQAGTQVQIYREGPNGRENYVIDLAVLASNATLINAKTEGLIAMRVQPGDIINVPIAGTFFVDGAVKRPGSYPLGRRYSLMQALTAAGGVDRDLYSSDVTIFRQGASGVKPVNVNLSEILAGSIVDPEIEADDVILVPINTVKYVYFRVFGQILGWSTSIANTAAWAGS